MRRKCGSDIRAPLVSINTSYPLELVCMDYLTLEPSKGGIGNILVVTDHFTKFAMAIPTKNQTAKTTAEAFYNNFIIHYGIPTRIHADQGANFESNIIKELCQLTNMEKTRTSIYHPQGNAGPERFNRTLLGMLGTLENDQKADWKRYINSLVYAYNCTPQSSTKYSPFEIMFGRKPKLPVDSMFEQVTENQNRTTKDYIDDLQNRIEVTKEIVLKHLKKSKERQKSHYDLKAKAVTLSIGDRVLVKVLAFEGKHKIQDRFENDMYTVIEQPNEHIPVYKVKAETSGAIRTLHRNHLFPIGDRIAERTEPLPKKRISLEKKKVVATQEIEKRNMLQEKIDVSESSEDSDEEMIGGSGTRIVDTTVIHGDAHAPERYGRKTSNIEVIARRESTNDLSKEDRTGTEFTNARDGEERSLRDSWNASENTVRTNDISNALDSNKRDIENENYTKDDGTAAAGHITDIQIRTDEKTVSEKQCLESKNGTEGGESGETVTERQVFRVENPDAISPPIPAPRRSQREKRRPAWFDSYQMNQVVVKPHDSKLEALNVLMSSGILEQIDRTVVYSILDSIIK